VPSSAERTVPGRRSVWRWVLWSVAGLGLMLAVAWWALLFQILPRIDTWREAMAGQATQALGVNVRLGQVSGQADGFTPMLAVRDVVLLDEHGQPALELPEVRARLSWRSLWPGHWWRGEVQLAELTVVRP